MGFQNLSIQRKLMVISVLTAVTTLLLASAAFFAFDVVTFRQKIADDLSILAATVEGNVRDALVFNDAELAGEVLSGLEAQPRIIGAWLFDREGEVFAQYVRDADGAVTPQNPSTEDGQEFSENKLSVHRAVKFNDRLVGTVYIESDLNEIEQRLASYVRISIAILVGSSIIALLLAAFLQRVVSRPIVQLVRLVKRISETKDYSLRAPHGRDDEVGRLNNGINQMLGTIEQRDEDLREARDRAEQANRAKSVFLANMSHELRTPLTAIIGYSEILEDDAQDMGLTDFLPDLQKIQTAGKHLLGLINSILDLSKIEAGKMELFIEEVQLEKLVSGVAATVDPLIEKNNNDLDVICPEGIGSIHTDETKIRQILFNLLSNASKFTENGVIRLEVGPRSEGDVEGMVFKVRDSGIGMSPEQLSRLFQPFTQADATTAKNYGGTGLGLALCKRFAELMGGNVHVTSEKGKGTEFTVWLPVDGRTSGPSTVSQRLESNEWTRPDIPQSDGGQLVLVIDDDLAVLELLTEFLRKEGFRTVAARDGEEGLAMAIKHKPDIITLDVQMPGKDGWTVLGALKSDPELSEIPVIMISVDEAQQRSYSLGADEFLTKPIDRTRLASVLSRYGEEESSAGILPLGLVVDDDASIRSLLCTMLQEQGWRVAEADNGLAGLGKVKDETPSAILLDLLMPQMDGFAFLNQLRQNPDWKRIPVIVLTAMELSGEDRARLDGGVASVLQKSTLTVEDLKEQILDLTE